MVGIRTTLANMYLMQRDSHTTTCFFLQQVYDSALEAAHPEDVSPSTSGGSRISRSGGVDFVRGDVDSRGSYISKVWYVKTKESGPSWWDVHRARPPLDPPLSTSEPQTTIEAHVYYIGMLVAY